MIVLVKKHMFTKMTTDSDFGEVQTREQKNTRTRDTQVTRDAREAPKLFRHSLRVACPRVSRDARISPALLQRTDFAKTLLAVRLMLASFQTLTQR